MTAPNFARLEANSLAPLLTLTALEVEGEGHAQTCRAVTPAGSAVFFLPPAVSPALLPLPSGQSLLLPDLTDPTPCAYFVPSELLPEVRRLLDLRPAALEEEAPTSEPDSRFVLNKWEPVAWYAPTSYGRDLLGRLVVPALPAFRRTVRSGKGGKA